MRFTGERSEDGITERLFELTVAGDVVPGVLWAPEGATGPRPLVLIGHGGGQHKTAPPVIGMARRYIKALGCAVCAIDAPEHGARVPPAEAPALAQRAREQMTRSGGMRGEALDATMARAAKARPEWTAALDAVQGLAFVGASGKVGYAGVSMGAFIGIPFVADEPRVTAAMFGLAGAPDEGHALVQAARRIAIPIEFALQWDDEMVSREAGLSLFGAFGSKEKTMHANAGGHMAVPVFERASWEGFFARHLGATSGS